MDKAVVSMVDDPQLHERLESIAVATETTRRYKCVNRVRDLPDFILDEPKQLGGEDAGPTPMEVGLCALNSCTAMTLTVLRREKRIKIGGLRLETTAIKDVRTVEARRRGIAFSQVEPIAYHYYKVQQKVFIKTSIDDELLAHLKSETERLCPFTVLFRDANIELESIWIRED